MTEIRIIFKVTFLIRTSLIQKDRREKNGYQAEKQQQKVITEL